MPPAQLLDGLSTTMPYRPARISVGCYHAMISSGLLEEDASIELLDGVLVETVTKNPPHAIATGQCHLALLAIVPQGWHVRNQDAITLETSEPEPDLVVARGAMRDFAQRHPGPDDIGLVIEVADSSLATDRYKGSLYAAANIPFYWIINISESVVEVYSAPNSSSRRYQQSMVVSIGNSVPVTLDERLCGYVELAAILP